MFDSLIKKENVIVIEDQYFEDSKSGIKGKVEKLPLHRELA